MESQTPIRQSLCGSLRRDGHWKCLCLTLLIVGCLAAISWCHLTISERTMLSYVDVSFSSSERTGPCKEGYIYIPVAFVVMLYLVYLVECWHSHTRLELRYKCDMTTVYNTINDMQAALPVIWWKATCYHYVRRTRQVMRYRNGDAFTSTQVYYERVDSSTAGAAFNFTHCGVKDISRPLSELEKYPAIKIKISKGFSFANLDTEFEFEEQRTQFFQEYETRDDYMEGREGMDLMNVDFKEYMIAFRDPNNLPWYVSHVVFWLASVLMLSWPLRAIIEYKTAHLHYHIHKLFGSNYLDSENYPNLMSRVSTMNSVELEMSIRNNNVIVPSYSEAMLAEAHDQLHRRDYGAIKAPHSKFPRSLTNVTLASRSTASRRSITPAVTMNQVKKFKSCSAFGISESTESSLNAGTIRTQIQQLLRDRGKLQRKRTTQSQNSISGISIGNGNVRFHVGTPDDVMMTPSFSSHSVTSSRTNETFSEEAAISNDITSRFERPRSQCQGPPRAKRSSRHHAPLLGAINRSKSVPESEIGRPDNAGSLRAMTGSGSSAQSTSRGLGLNLSSVTRPTPRPTTCDTAVTTERPPVTATAAISPTTPPSPPAYEEAIMMRRIAPANVTNVPSALVNSASEIGLTRNSLALRTRGEIPVTGARAFRDGKQNTDSISSAPPIERVINRSLSVEPSGSSRSDSDSSSLENSRFKSLTFSGPNSSSQQHLKEQQNRQQQQQRQRPQTAAPVLKALPKVSTDICTESEDSDTECLHSAASESADLESLLSGGDYLSNGASQRSSFGFGSIAQSPGTLIVQDGVSADLSFDPNASFYQPLNHSTPSTAVSNAAAAIASSSRSQSSPSRRMETSV